MHSLPYIIIQKNQIIPLPGCTYSLVFAEEENIVTGSLVTKRETIKNAFIILFSHKDKLLEKGVLCMLDDQALKNNTTTIFFTSLKEIKKINIVNDRSNFVFYNSPPSNSHKKYIKYLLEHIAASDLFYEFPFISLLLESYTFYSINKFLTFLDVEDKILSEYFFTNDLYKKLTIVYDLIVSKISFNQLSQQFEDPEAKIYPEHVAKVLEEENLKLNNLSKMNSEYHNITEYISFVEKLPWSSYSTNQIKLRDLKKELNSTHYGLDEVKEYILDYFASLLYSKSNTGTAILFNGPPGTGKTTIAKSIAKALGREYIFISLAGIEDESEIRGHRRTYVGARAGRILTALSRATTINPVIVLDEIDKVSSGFKGNPKAALLELLDFEQNTSFVDRYLEIPIDLSACIYIATSNYIKNIDLPLLDRLFTIEFKDYSLEEKITIVNTKVIPHLNNKYKIKKNNKIIFQKELIQKLSKEKDLRQITKYLEKLYMTACRKFLSKHKEIVFDTSYYTVKKQKNKIGFS